MVESINQVGHVMGVQTIAEVRHRGDSGSGTIPLQDPDLAAGELQRCVKELGLRGVQIGSHVDGNAHLPNESHNLDERSLDPVWNAAEQSSAAILSIPGTWLEKSGCQSIGCLGWSACRRRRLSLFAR